MPLLIGQSHRHIAQNRFWRTWPDYSRLTAKRRSTRRDYSFPTRPLADRLDIILRPMFQGTTSRLNTEDPRHGRFFSRLWVCSVIRFLPTITPVVIRQTAVPPLEHPQEPQSANSL